LYHHGLVLAPLAMRMVMNVLRIGWNFAGTTLRRLVQILRTVVPATLATMRDILTAERTPAGSDHAPTPGAFPIAAEECKAAAEAPSTDNVDLEPSSRQVHPEAAGIQSQQTILKHFNLIERHPSTPIPARAHLSR
jgi:hypothetical protein